MGTPDFAVPTLDALVQGGYNVVGVITMPDKPAGRGHKVQFSPVKEYAIGHNLPLLQPEKLKDEAFLAALREWRADLQIVVAFRMLPEVVWNMPRCGTFNLHAALLPQYRGAAPINWAVMNGEYSTGVTTFFLDENIDTGRIIRYDKVRIFKKDNCGTLYDRLKMRGMFLVIKTVNIIIKANGKKSKMKLVNQNEIIKDLKKSKKFELRPAPKIFKETCQIDWTASATKIYNQVRGLSPYPAAWTSLTLPSGEVLSPVKIYKVEKRGGGTLPIGQMATDGRSYIEIGCADGIISLLELQLPGKKRMDVKALLNGMKLA